ncbi:MAG TPA: FkbM family methyltransferase [Patescibacteria group bacterium]|nr:FkbM family methyltransferase [Patescibacteria group bacterium]
MRSISLPNGMEISVNNSTEAKILYYEIFTTGTYAKHGIKVSPGDCVFDVGANIGMFSMCIASQFPDLTLYAFEPIPELFSILQSNAKKHLERARSYKLLKTGLSDSFKKAEFQFSSKMSIAAGMYSADVDGNVSQKAGLNPWLRAIIADGEKTGIIPAKTSRLLQNLLLKRTTRLATAIGLAIPFTLFLIVLKASFKKVECELQPVSNIIKNENISRIDLMKIDVEGAEFDVLQGIADGDWPKIRQFVIEVHDIDNRVKAMTEFLQSRNYTVVVDQEDWELHKLMNIYTMYAHRP